MIKLLRKVNLAALTRFALGGVLSAIVTLGSTALLHEFGSVREHVAAAAGLVLALAVNFFVLRLFVFRGTQTGFLRQMLMFLASSGVFRAFEYGAFFVLNVFFHVQYLLALVLVLGVSFLMKFFVFDGFIFRRSAKSTTADSQSKVEKTI